MRRYAMMAMMVLAAGAVTGCQDKNAGVAMGEQDSDLTFPEGAVPSSEPVSSPINDSLSQPVDTTNHDTPVTTQQPSGSYGTDGGRTYIVKKGDTLYSIARAQYNGEMSNWRRIYEANRASLTSGPDSIEVGTTLVLP